MFDGSLNRLKLAEAVGTAQEVSVAEILAQLKEIALGGANLPGTTPIELAMKEILTGATYALARSIELGFYRSSQDDAVSTTDQFDVESILKGIHAGLIPHEGQWLAGFYLNSAIYRIAAGYHPALKILTGKNWHTVPRLVSWAKREKLIKNDDINYLDKIYDEVKKFKHDPAGPHEVRIVTLKLALDGLSQLISLASRHA